MCSIIEAWGDNDYTQLTGRNSLPAANEASMNSVRNSQQAMDVQRMNRQVTDISAIRAMSMYPESDKVGEPVTWADDRRQYARPAGELFNQGSMPSSDAGWATAYCKPRPDMNSMTRGVHSKYSREKRFDSRTADLPYGGQITTDVDPALLVGDTQGRPGYLDLYSTGYEGRKWMPNMTTTTTQPPRIGDARPEAGINPPPTTTTPYTQRPSTTQYNPNTTPTPANDVPEKFMQIYEDTFDNTHQAHNMSNMNNMNNMNDITGTNKSSFTQEVITDPRLIAENRAARADQATATLQNTSSVMPTSKVAAVPDEVKAIQAQLNVLVAKMNTLEQKVTYVENNKSHDIILFIVIAIFILFVIDNVFKLGKFS
jgi:hypothetical protein